MQYKVVRTYPRGYCGITTEQLEKAFDEGWQFAAVNQIGKDGVLEFEDILKNAQITNKELAQYLGDKREPYGGWYVFNAIHITELEIFDKPKEISEFNAYCKKSGMECLHCKHYWTDDSAGYSIPKCSGKPLTRAPQSFMFIEV